MNPSDVHTLLIADDHPLFLENLRAMLQNEPAVQVVAEVQDGAEAWRLILALRPQIAVLDLAMPGLDGLEVAQRVRRHRLPVRLIILTLHNEESLFRRAMEIGVSGYLIKEDVATDLLPCLRSVLSNRPFVAPALALSRHAPSPALASGEVSQRLNATQLEIFRLLGRGHTTQEIAGTLGIQSQTVENHFIRIAERLGLRGSDSLRRFAAKWDEKSKQNSTGEDGRKEQKDPQKRKT